MLIDFTKKYLGTQIKRYPAPPTHILPSFKFFVVKLRLLRKSSYILLLGVANTALVLRFMKSNKFYYVETAKVVNFLVVKDVSCQRITFCPWLGIFAHFSNSNFLVIVYK